MNDRQINQKKPKKIKLHKNHSINIKNKIPTQTINNISSNKASSKESTNLFFNKKHISNIKLNHYIKNNFSNKKIPLTKQKNINAFKNKLGQLQLNISNFSCYNKNMNQTNSVTNKNNLTKMIKNKIPNANINKFITLQRNITLNNNLGNYLSKNISRSKSKSNSKNLSKELINNNNIKKSILEKYIKRKYLTKNNTKNNLVKNTSFNTKQSKVKKNLFKQKNKSSNLLTTKYFKIKNSNKNKRNNLKNMSNNYSNNDSISKKNNTNSLINNNINKKYLPNKQVMNYMKKKKFSKTKNHSYKNLDNKDIKNQNLICINNYTNKNNNYLINERLRTEYCSEDEAINNFIFSKKYSKKDLLYKDLYSKDDNKELYETESIVKTSTNKINKDNSDALSFDEVKDIIIYNNFTDIDIKKEYLFKKEERKIFEENNEIKYIEFFFKENNIMEEGYNKAKFSKLGNNNEIFSLDTEYSSKMKTKVNKNLVKNIKDFN